MNATLPIYADDERDFDELFELFFPSSHNQLASYSPDITTLCQQLTGDDVRWLLSTVTEHRVEAETMRDMIICARLGIISDGGITDEYTREQVIQREFSTEPMDPSLKRGILATMIAARSALIAEAKKRIVPDIIS